MSIQIVRFAHQGRIGWGVRTGDAVAPLAIAADTTRAFIEAGGRDAAIALDPGPDEGLPAAAVTLLSPVTPDGDYICQAMNYASHLHEIGRKRSDVLANVFFTKASSCITGPDDPVIRPDHVRLLDYEIELGMVIGRSVTGPETVTTQTLQDMVFGWVITNDISARDVQISHEQFHKAKSYRSFGPTGPFLVIPEPGETIDWRKLELVLKVNGEIRQRSLAGDMIYDPLQTLTELSAVRDLKPGDMIATGTPGGVALKPPSRTKIALAGFLPPAKRFQAFLKSQAGVSAYLRDGDRIEASIRDAAGRVDLGVQHNTIVPQTLVLQRP